MKDSHTCYAKFIRLCSCKHVNDTGPWPLRKSIYVHSIFFKSETVLPWMYRNWPMKSPIEMQTVPLSILVSMMSPWWQKQVHTSLRISVVPFVCSSPSRRRVFWLTRCITNPILPDRSIAGLRVPFDTTAFDLIKCGVVCLGSSLDSSHGMKEH